MVRLLRSDVQELGTKDQVISTDSIDSVLCTLYPWG